MAAGTAGAREKEVGREEVVGREEDSDFDDDLDWAPKSRAQRSRSSASGVSSNAHREVLFPQEKFSLAQLTCK